MKNKKSNSLKNSMAINNRAIKMIYKKYPQMVISTIISSIWTAVTPYVVIYLSALIIEELAGAKNVERLKDVEDVFYKLGHNKHVSKRYDEITTSESFSSALLYIVSYILKSTQSSESQCIM